MKRKFLDYQVDVINHVVEHAAVRNPEDLRDKLCSVSEIFQVDFLQCRPVNHEISSLKWKIKVKKSYKF